MSNYIKKIVTPLVIVSFLLSVFFTLKQAPGSGDEALFISDLKYITDFGWIEAIKKGISIPYMVLAYPFTLIFKNYVALRIVNVGVLSALFLYFMYRKVNTEFYILALFYLTTARFFLIGSNDALFFLGLIIFFFEVYQLTLNKEWKANFAILALLLAFFTRALTLVYLPLILFSFYFIYKYGKLKIKQLIPSIFFFCVFMGLNSPCILQNKMLSYDKKNPPKEVQANWSQRQYLAQLKVNKGELKNNSHPTWKETDEYLKINGEQALPKSMLESLFFDIELTIKEFFKDFYFTSIYGFRQLSLMYLFPFIMLFYYIINKERDIRKLYFPIIHIAIISIFSFIIISFVELRWLTPIFLLAIAYYTDLYKNIPYGKVLYLVNNVLIFIFSIYGLFNLIPKL